MNKLEEKTIRNPTNNKKLIKTTKYNNIKSQVPRKYIIGKSVNIRKNEFNNREKNLIMDKKDDYNFIEVSSDNVLDSIEALIEFQEQYFAHIIIRNEKNTNN